MYRQEVDKIKNAVYGTPFEKIQNLGLLGTFSLISANILRYLNLKDDQHYKLIQDIQFHRALSNVDQYCPHTLKELKVKDNSAVLETESEKGQIFVTFHTGSFRLFIQHLNRIGLPFCLVTEGKYIEEQGEVTQALFKQVNGENRGLEILEAENPRLLFELLKRINSGISVVFYIDGNTGVSEKKLSDNKNLLKINFLHSDIYARQGISMLAYLSKANVVLALTKRNKDLTNTVRLKKISTKKYEKKTRAEFINGLTQSLFWELSHFLNRHPEQWEGWFYIQKFFEEENNEKEHDFLPTEKYAGENEIILGVDQYIQLIKYDEENVFIITKRDYQIMKISPMLYDVLIYFKDPKNVITNSDMVINDHTVKWEFLEELIEMNFLAA